MHPIPDKHRGHGGGSLRVFEQFAWLEVGSGKMVLSRPTHQRVTQAVGRLERASDIIFDDHHPQHSIYWRKIS